MKLSEIRLEIRFRIHDKQLPDMQKPKREWQIERQASNVAANGNKRYLLLCNFLLL